MNTALLMPSECLALFSTIVERRPVALPAAERLNEFNRFVTAFVIADRIETFHIGPPIQPWALHVVQTPWLLPLLSPETNFRVHLSARGNLEFSHGPLGPDWGAYSHFRGIDFISAAPHAFFSSTIPPRLHSPPIEAVLENVPAAVRPLVNLYAATRLSVLDVPVRVQHAHPDLQGIQVSVNFAQPAALGTARILADHPVLAQKNDALLRVLGYKRPAAAECLRLLEERFGTGVKALHEARDFDVVIPPVTAVLLNRLPDGCKDVGTVVSELMELRDEWQRYRTKFAKVEAVMQDPESSLADLRNARAALNADAERFARECAIEVVQSARARVAFDGILAVVRLASIERLATTAVLGALQSIIPRVGDFAARSQTSIAFKAAKEAFQMPGYGTLASRKLGLDDQSRSST